MTQRDEPSSQKSPQQQPPQSHQQPPQPNQPTQDDETSDIDVIKNIKLFFREVFRPTLAEDASLQERWERRGEGPLFLASLLFLVLFAWSSLSQTDNALDHIADIGMWLVWLGFLIDYLVRLALAKHRWRWFFKHIWELALVILPMFRPLRVLRVLPTLVLMQRFSASNARVTVTWYTSVASILLLIVAALTLFDAEAAAPDTEVNTFPDALWWALTTVTTVGYGDIAPVSTQGRMIASVLMLSGIAIAGVVTAMVSSWLVQQVQNDSDKQEQLNDDARHHELMNELASLRAEMREMREQLQQLQSSPGDGSNHAESDSAEQTPPRDH